MCRFDVGLRPHHTAARHSGTAIPAKPVSVPGVRSCESPGVRSCELAGVRSRNVTDMRWSGIENVPAKSSGGHALHSCTPTYLP